MVDESQSPPSSGRRAQQTQATRQALLDSAREVFVETGYERALKTEILNRASVSNGSLYHHFGGKAELFLALYQFVAEERAAKTEEAVRASVSSGVTDPVSLYVVSCRAYLEVSWAQRDLTLLFASGEGPAGIAAAREQAIRAWHQRTADTLGKSPENPLVLALTAVVSEAGRHLAQVGDAEEAERIRSHFLRILDGMAHQEP